ncbi:MAG: hypothetical protein JXR37_17720 [Kiritimatiellae bacterium]|nr:hypothetical protein [Kiritimatiellia bacterium]
MKHVGNAVSMLLVLVFVTTLAAALSGCRTERTDKAQGPEKKAAQPEHPADTKPKDHPAH